MNKKVIDILKNYKVYTAFGNSVVAFHDFRLDERTSQILSAVTILKGYPEEEALYTKMGEVFNNFEATKDHEMKVFPKTVNYPSWL